jgi:excisionase family DNA binding protein
MMTDAKTNQQPTQESDRDTGLLNRVQAARWLGIHPRTLDRLRDRGELPAVKIGRRSLYRLETLRAYARSREVRGPSWIRS